MPSAYSWRVAHLAVVSFRLGATDGVSIEAAKWVDAFISMGHRVTTIAGEGCADVVMPQLAIRATVAPRLDDLTRALGDAEVVVVENFVSLPLNVAAREVLYQALEHRRALFRHHDLAWEREQWREDDAPRNRPDWRHVTINDLSRHALDARDVHAITIRNAFDCSPPVGRRDETRRALGVASERVAFMPTRAIPRKNVAGAIAFAERLDAVLWLLGPAEDGYDSALEDLVSTSRARIIRGRPAGFDIHDAYSASDVVVMPSTWEGFGNPVLESVTHRRPLAVNPYPVLREIESYGFRFFALDDTETVARFLDVPEPGLFKHNVAIALEHFNAADLPARLAPILESLRV